MSYVYIEYIQDLKQTSEDSKNSETFSFYYQLRLYWERIKRLNNLLTYLPHTSNPEPADRWNGDDNGKMSIAKITFILRMCCIRIKSFVKSVKS